MDKINEVINNYRAGSIDLQSCRAGLHTRPIRVGFKAGKQ